MPPSYEQHEMTRIFMDLMRIQAYLTAHQTEAILMPFQAWLNGPFNPMNYWDGAKIEAKGMNTLARAIPSLSDFAERLPDSVEIKFETANDNRQPVKSHEDKKKLELTLSLNEPHKNWEALSEIFNMAAKEYPKPDFGIEQATILGEQHDVKQTVLVNKAFAGLRLFETGHDGPLLYIAAPVSGHYSTLIRETIQASLNAGFRVAIYDIKNTRDVPKDEGSFGLDDCVDYHREFIEYLGKNIDPRVNVQAICQATVPISMAAATLAAEGSPYTPFTLDLDAGPINPHASMTEVTEFAKKYDIDWFKNNLISNVPAWFDGAGRRVYPGFRQIAAFIAMNPAHHARSFYEMFNHLVKGTADEQDFVKKSDFYEEYLSVCDLPAQFYLDTIKRVFIDNQLAKGEMTWHGQPVDLSAYKNYLLTKEASLDDISAPGQTMYAHKLMPEAKGHHYTLKNAGHYGIFAGSQARNKGLPAMFQFIHRALRENGHDYGPVLDSYGNEIKKPRMPHAFKPEMLDKTIETQKGIWAEFVKTREQSMLNDIPQIAFTFPRFKMGG